MATQGNCSMAGTGGYTLSNNQIWWLGFEFNFTDWVRVTNISWLYYTIGDAKACRYKICIYKKVPTALISRGTKVYESSFYLRSFGIEEDGYFEMNSAMDILLAPGKYNIAVFIDYCTGSAHNICRTTSGTTIDLRYKGASSPPDPLGSGWVNRVPDKYTVCVTYETLSETDIVIQATTPDHVPFDLTPVTDLKGLDSAYGTPFETVLPTNSTFDVILPSTFNDIKATDVGPSSIATMANSYAIRWSQKVVDAQGLFWAFYVRPGTPAYMYFKTSSDGLTWSEETLVREVNYRYAETCGVFYDGTFFHVHIKDGTRLYLRVGTPQTDGSISWLSDFSVMVYAHMATTLTDHTYYHGPGTISYWAWHYEFSGVGPSALNMYWNPSTHDVTDDGFWGKNTIGTQVTTTDFRTNKILGLPDNKVMILCFKTESYMYQYLFDGSWTGPTQMSEVTIATQYITGLENWAWDAIVDTSGNVHLVYHDTSFDIRYTKRDYTTGLWQKEVVLFNGTRYDHDCKIVLDEATGDLYVFTAHAPTTDHIGYRKYDASRGIWYPMVDWIDTTAYGGLATRDSSNDWGGHLNAPRRVRNSRIPVTFITNPTNAHVVRFKLLNLANLMDYKFLKWEDDSTNTTRRIILTGSTFDAEYAQNKQLTEDFSLAPWIKIKMRDIRTLVLGSSVSFKTTKSLTEDLSIAGKLIFRIPKLLFESISFLGTITRVERWPVLHKVTVYIGTLSRTVTITKGKVIAYIKERIMNY